MQLTDAEKAMLDGARGDGQRQAGALPARHR